MSDRSRKDAMRIAEPPRDEETEAAVLGAMMMSANVVGNVTERLRADDFYSGTHRRIFEVIVDLFGEGKPVDTITVKNKLASRGLDVDPLKLYDLGQAVTTTAAAPRHADILAEIGTRRRLFLAAHEAVRLAEAGAPDAVGKAEELIYRVSNDDRSRDAVVASDAMFAYLDALGEDDHVPGLPTGLRDLDRKLTGRGMKPGQLIVVAARPGVGKSALVTNIARNIARSDHAVVLFSLEMSTDELAERLLYGETRSRSTEDLYGVVGTFAGLPLWIVDSPVLNIVDIRARARRLKATANLRLAIVDYLQLMSSSNRTESRQQEVADISRGLKVLAKELHIPVIAVSQLNRKVEERKSGRPQLTDLRESGAIEQDSDIVLLIHRDEAGDAQSPGKAEVIIAKQRNGPTGVVYLTFLPNETKFVDYAQEERE